MKLPTASKLFPKLATATVVLWAFTITVWIINMHADADSFMFGPRALGATLSVFSTLLTVIVGYSVLGSRPVDNEKKAVSGPIAKILSVFIVVGVVLSSYAAIKSLWIEPSYTKFAYENTSVISGIAAALLVSVLSAVQKDIYWITRKRAEKFDERQLQSRQQVFEISYKIGAVIILAVAWIIPSYAYTLPAIISIDYDNNVPGHLFWPLYDLAILFFALPLIVAAWYRQQKPKNKHEN